jgi:type II secretory pathway pseudopilin PulG
MCATPTVLQPCAPARDERGFGVIELVIVLLLLAIMMAMLISTFGGSKRAASHKLAAGAASNYAEAIESYMADNGQSPPTIGSAAWPASPNAQLLRGPVDILLRGPGGGGKPYLPSVPDAVDTGRVQFLGPGQTSSSPASPTITYSVNGPYYELRVRTPGNTVRECIITNAPTPPGGVPKCG